MKGHCHCGAVGFETGGPVAWSAYCHCADCRRNCAAPVTAFFGVPHGSVIWRGSPKVRQSSPGVERLFCPDCGTPMAYRTHADAVNVHLYTATLDDPHTVPPQMHVHYRQHLDWLQLGDDLPRHSASDE